jgi:tetratricopeptide (TPR) repeat protein
VWFYLGKLLWPHPLIFVYPRWKIDASQISAYAPMLALVAGLPILWWKRNGWGRAPLVALLYFVSLLFLVLGFFNVFYFRYSFVADHFQYLASIGPLALAAAGIKTALGFSRKGNRLLKPLFCGALLLTLGVLTWRQSRVYAGIETLWRTTIDRNPACWIAHNNLANALLKKGRVDDAIILCQQALAIEPDYGDAHYNLGIALLLKKQPDEAIVQFQKTLALQPDNADALDNLGIALVQKGQTDEAIVQFQKTLAFEPDNADAHYEFGNALLRKKQADEAIVEFQRALAIGPDNADAHDNLGIALVQKGQLDEAIIQFQQALAIQPTNAEVHNNLATALIQKGQLDEAITQFQKTLAIQPNNAEVHVNLGTALIQKGKMDEAIIQFQKALAVNPGLVKAQNSLANVAWMLATSPNPSVRNGTQAVELAEQTDRLSGGKNPVMAATLAAAYAEAGRFPEAITNVGRALQLANGQNNAVLVVALEDQLKLYQAGSPFHHTGATH